MAILGDDFSETILECDSSTRPRNLYRFFESSSLNLFSELLIIIVLISTPTTTESMC